MPSDRRRGCLTVLFVLFVPALLVVMFHRPLGRFVLDRTLAYVAGRLNVRLAYERVSGDVFSRVEFHDLSLVWNGDSMRVRELAVKAYVAIDCAGMARADFLLSRETGALYVNELNTIPGFTAISMYPKMWAHSGLSYPKLIGRLIDLALERHAARRETGRRACGGVFRTRTSSSVITVPSRRATRSASSVEWFQPLFRRRSQCMGTGTTRSGPPAAKYAAADSASRPPSCRYPCPVRPYFILCTAERNGSANGPTRITRWKRNATSGQRGQPPCSGANPAPRLPPQRGQYSRAARASNR